jgi:hypothetical protein
LMKQCYSDIIAITPATLERLRDVYGILEPEWRERFGHGFDALTESEARQVLRYKSADAVRSAVLARGNARLVGGLPEGMGRTGNGGEGGQGPGGKGPDDEGPDDAGAGGGLAEPEAGFEVGDPALAADAQRILDDIGDLDIVVPRDDGSTRKVSARTLLAESDDDANALAELIACIGKKPDVS